MAKPGFVHSFRFWFVLATFVLASICCNSNGSVLYEGDDFTFSAPSGYKTIQYETPIFDKTTKTEILLFSNVGHYPFFDIRRQKIPPGSDLDTVFTDYMSIVREIHSYHFQLISQNMLTIDGRPAIEVVHREFLGEPYVQTREIWMEYHGWAYSLTCTSQADGTPGAVIPVSERCIQLAEEFQFK